jgi:hypothetical protein
MKASVEGILGELLHGASLRLFFFLSFSVTIPRSGIFFSTSPTDIYPESGWTDEIYH